MNFDWAERYLRPENVTERTNLTGIAIEVNKIYVITQNENVTCQMKMSITSFGRPELQGLPKNYDKSDQTFN